MANPVSTLHVGEVVYFKVHALAGTTHGTLFLTNLRLLFLAFEAPPSPADVLLEVPLNAIAELAEARPGTPATAMASQLEVACKNFAFLRFHFPIDATSGYVCPGLELWSTVHNEDGQTHVLSVVWAYKATCTCASTRRSRPNSPSLRTRVRQSVRSQTQLAGLCTTRSGSSRGSDSDHCRRRIALLLASDSPT